jgi:hypothetical protein
VSLEGVLVFMDRFVQEINTGSGVEIEIEKLV